ncbi:hypothetical protein SAMN06265348_10815 [Pedobacter westerhofensis]|uniref:Uncharacterized protein n=1 Tax=Pedobacter westerhofensis TaxID=425512 RepID=A0A521EFT5_9SPHI|nr:hypothetical protein [Pedobacter westerhofensis]SMO82331.1 hypothetical protein SAMN06265348_10815 [Pedobacter westerhofensis]
MVRNLINFKKAWLGAFALLLMVGVITLTFAFKAENNKVQELANAKAKETVNKKRTITYNFLVQSSLNSFTGRTSASNACTGTATLNCKYNVTPSGKANIPDQEDEPYTASQINAYVTAGYLTVASGSSPGLYP